MPQPASSLGAPRPPEKGAFPLDHFHECTEIFRKYQECLKSNNMINTSCRHLSKDYLKCRMDNGLMEKESWKNLGFAEKEFERKIDVEHTERQKEKKGFVAGAKRARVRKEQLSEATEK